tara:strand:- start:830 stop:1198 length:369 start_codon:yes stop_codon:yes gene_type:complete
MNIIFRIDEYLPETNQIVIQLCKETSRNSILSHEKVAINCETLDLYDAESFSHTLSAKYGSGIIAEENRNEPILDDNKNSEIIKGDLNLEKLVGKVIKYDFYDLQKHEFKSRFRLNARRVEL